MTEFLAAPESDTQVYELVGTIEGNINTTYGFFDLKDETGSVYVYGLTATPLGYNTKKNDHSYSSLGLNPGDRIRIRGYRGSFGDKIQMMYAWFVKKVSGDTPGGDTPGGDTPGGDTPGGDTTTAGTVDNPYTVAQALDAVKGLTWTSNTDYESTDDVYMKGRISRIESKGTFTEGGTYGNASFYISDDGAEKNEFYCFRILYLGNTKFAEGQTDIKVGDDVVICGKLMNYKGNTPETVAGLPLLAERRWRRRFLIRGKGVLRHEFGRPDLVRQDGRDLWRRFRDGAGRPQGRLLQAYRLDGNGRPECQPCPHLLERCPLHRIPDRPADEEDRHRLCAQCRHDILLLGHAGPGRRRECQG